MINQKEKAIKRIVSFGFKTAAGYIPVIGPILSSGLSEIEGYISDLETSKATNEIINKLKENSENLILHNHSNNNLIEELTNSDVELDIWFEKYINHDDQLNINEKMQCVAGKFLYEHLKTGDFTEEQTIKIYSYIYDFVCECESEIWVENDLKSFVYLSISRFLTHRLKEYEAAMFYSIKAIEETNDYNYRMGLFFEGYLHPWAQLYVKLLNSPQTEEIRIKAFEMYWNILVNTVFDMQSHKVSKKTPLQNSKTFKVVSTIQTGKNIDLQINILISYMVAVLKNKPQFIDRLIEISDLFYETNDKLGNASYFAPDLREQAKYFFDDLFQL